MPIVKGQKEGEKESISEENKEPQQNNPQANVRLIVAMSDAYQALRTLQAAKKNFEDAEARVVAIERDAKENRTTP